MVLLSVEKKRIIMKYKLDKAFSSVLEVIHVIFFDSLKRLFVLTAHIDYTNTHHIDVTKRSGVVYNHYPKFEGDIWGITKVMFRDREVIVLSGVFSTYHNSKYFFEIREPDSYQLVKRVETEIFVNVLFIDSHVRYVVAKEKNEGRIISLGYVERGSETQRDMMRVISRWTSSQSTYLYHKESVLLVHNKSMITFTKLQL